MSRELSFSVTQPQADFLSLDCMFPLFVGGVGSGKSHTMAISAVMDASHSSSALIALYEPTYHHIRTIILPRIEQILSENGIAYKYNKQEHTLYTSSGQFGDFIFLTLDNPSMIVGFEAYRSHIDELDVLPEDKAREAWMKIISRSRQNPKGVIDVKNRVSAYTTPEGYKFVYKMWGASAEKRGQVYVNTQNDRYQMVKAKTKENPYVSEEFVQSLMDTYPVGLITAYLEGEFVNLNSQTIYNSYDRSIHDSQEQIMPNETLYIGCDFNVNNTAATVYVRRNGGYYWHAVDELCGVLDTPSLIKLIKERWAGHHIVMYPDASGSARKSVNATESDIGLLQQAGFEIRARRKNPDVRDRIQAANRSFSTGRVFVNSRNCPTVARCLEQQSYDKNNEPDKRSGHDHQNDATTYPLAYEMPIKKPMFALDFSFIV